LRLYFKDLGEVDPVKVVGVTVVVAVATLHLNNRKLSLDILSSLLWLLKVGHQ
jgi:hypothetical protein